MHCVFETYMLVGLFKARKEAKEHMVALYLTACNKWVVCITVLIISTHNIQKMTS